jgi:putative flippase GtrA
MATNRATAVPATQPERHAKGTRPPAVWPSGEIRARALDVQLEPEGTVRPEGPELARCFAQYCVVGGSGYLVNTVVYWVALHLLVYQVAFAGAFILAATSNYCLNRSWTFSGRGKVSRAPEFIRYLAVSVATLGVNLAALTFLVHSYGLSSELAVVFSLAIATPVSFGANRLWTFQARDGIQTADTRRRVVRLAGDLMEAGVPCVAPSGRHAELLDVSGESGGAGRSPTPCGAPTAVLGLFKVAASATGRQKPV